MLSYILLTAYRYISKFIFGYIKVKKYIIYSVGISMCPITEKINYVKQHDFSVTALIGILNILALTYQDI